MSGVLEGPRVGKAVHTACQGTLAKVRGAQQDGPDDDCRRSLDGRVPRALRQVGAARVEAGDLRASQGSRIDAQLVVAGAQVAVLDPLRATEPVVLVAKLRQADGHRGLRDLRAVYVQMQQ